MIRFCDGYMISVDKNEISRQNLLSVICKEHLENYVFAVMDEKNGITLHILMCLLIIIYGTI